MDCSTKDENGLFHKRCKYIDPQNQKMDLFTKTKQKRLFDRDISGKIC
jgi:hypothetical protein